MIEISQERKKRKKQLAHTSKASVSNCGERAKRNKFESTEERREKDKGAVGIPPAERDISD